MNMSNPTSGELSRRTSIHVVHMDRQSKSMQTVKVTVQTIGFPSASPLMFHCHIREHEDAGMMGQFITE